MIFFTIVFALFLPKSKNYRFFLTLLALGLNPIANQIGPFSNSSFLLAGNLFMHVIFPMALAPRVILGLLKWPSYLYIAIIISSLFSLLLPSEGLVLSNTSGIKTLILMLGSLLWAQALAEMVLEQYGFLLNVRFLLTCTLASIVILTISFIFSENYFADGRYQAAGGFNSPATLSAVIILLTLMNTELKILKKFGYIVLESIILALTGSRSVMIAILVSVFTIPMYFALSKKNEMKKFTTAMLPVALLAFAVIIYQSSKYIQNLRSLEFLSLTNSASKSGIGTLGFRENMLSRMLAEYSQFSVKSTVFGIGAGGGTVLAMNWISSLRDADYSSGRVFHNGLLQLLIENGIFGVSVFLIFVIVILVSNPVELKIRIIVWIPFFSIALFFSGNPFATSGLLAGIIYLPFLIKNYRSS